MPRYQFHNKETDEYYVEYLSMSELDVVLERYPHIELVPVAPAIISGIIGRNKPDQGFRDILREQKKHFDRVDKHQGTKNTINDWD